jgi:ribonuclease HI
MLQVHQHRIWFDGSITRNPGGDMSCGFVAEGEYSSHRYTSSTDIDAWRTPKTNNVAEYYGLIYALDFAKSEGWDDIIVYGDSMLVVKQVNGDWRCKKEHLKKLRKEASDLMNSFDSIELVHIPREENAEVDKLSKR